MDGEDFVPRNLLIGTDKPSGICEIVAVYVEDSHASEAIRSGNLSNDGFQYFWYEHDGYFEVWKRPKGETR